MNKINANALNIVVAFLCNIPDGAFYAISSTEISEVGKFYSPINMSVGINVFTNGKLDSSFLTFICAILKFQNCV